MFQSTLPRGERLFIRAIQGHAVRVSIHAPAGGATNNNPIECEVYSVSIHAPAGGATRDIDP